MKDKTRTHKFEVSEDTIRLLESVGIPNENPIVYELVDKLIKREIRLSMVKLSQDILPVLSPTEGMEFQRVVEAEEKKLSEEKDECEILAETIEKCNSLYEVNP